MDTISLSRISKVNNRIIYDFSATAGLSPYFSGKLFLIEYPNDIEEVPDAIAAIPFVCNVLPIIWLTDSELLIEELDQAFYECIPLVKAGYEKMFPESRFGGQISVKKIVPNQKKPTGRTATFFSGGLDAVHTLLQHRKEKPALIYIWGSDVRYDNVQGWKKVHSHIAEYAKLYQLDDIVIRSSFREFDREDLLQNRFSEQMKDGWWHGIKHSLGLIGHAAPYAFQNGLEKIYIASTNCQEDGAVRCASHPTTDNCVRFASARIVHDGFEYSRQKKVHNLIELAAQTGILTPLHVCWENSNGRNCCHCEKCYRTIAGIYAEGANPVHFGFLEAEDTVADMQRYILEDCKGMQALQDYWPHIRYTIIKNTAKLRKEKYWKHILWIRKADFYKREKLKMPVGYRLRVWLSRFKFYQTLHRWKERL